MHNKIEYFCSDSVKNELITDHNKNYEQTKDLEVSVLEEGYIVPAQVADAAISKKVLRTKYKYGGVVDCNFAFDKLSQVQDARIPSDNPNINGGIYLGISDEGKLQTPDYIDEKVIYIGDFRNHPAHFYLEGLSRFWIFLEQNDLKNCKIAYIGDLADKDNDYFHFFINAFGINPKNVIHITKLTKCKTIIIPEQSFKLNLSWHKAYIDVVEKIRSSVKPAKYKKVYFSKLPGHTINEDLAQQIFKDNGYEVFLPEKLTMAEKISILSGCEEFVSQNGSNAHYSLFCKPQTCVVVLNRSCDLHYVQTQIDQIRKLKATYIDSFFDLLPSWLSIGPFSFCANSYLTDFLNSRQYKYNEQVFKDKNALGRYCLVKKWYETYSNPEKMKLLESKTSNNEISIKNCVDALEALNSHFCTKNAIVHKELNILGIKIKYKVAQKSKV